MENPSKIDVLGVSLFLETPNSTETDSHFEKICKVAEVEEHIRKDGPSETLLMVELLQEVKDV